MKLLNTTRTSHPGNASKRPRVYFSTFSGLFSSKPQSSRKICRWNTLLIPQTALANSAVIPYQVGNVELTPLAYPLHSRSLCQWSRRLYQPDTYIKISWIHFTLTPGRRQERQTECHVLPDSQGFQPPCPGRERSGKRCVGKRTAKEATWLQEEKQPKIKEIADIAKQVW